MTPPLKDWDPDERRALEGLEGQLDAMRQRHGSEPPLELLRAAKGDALPGELQAAIGRHLAGSSWSQTLVEGAEQVEDSLDSSREARLLAAVKKRAAIESQAAITRRWMLPTLVASSLATIVVVVWVMQRGQGPQTSPALQPGTTIADASPPPAPAFQLPLEKADVKLSMAALTWRGASSDNQLLADLKPAFDAYRAGDYQAAEREFSMLTGTYPSVVEIPFYQGVTRLFLDDPAGASVVLMPAESLADETFASDIMWYRAIAEQRAGREAEARARLTSLCMGTSERAARACEALKQLESPNAR